MEITQEIAKRILKSRKVISKPGKYQVKVTSTHLMPTHFIINTNGMSPYDEKQAKQKYSEGEYEASLKSNLSTNVWVDEDSGEVKGFLPEKDEIINIVCDFVQTKSGETGLFITSISAIPVSATSSFSFDDLEEEKTEEDIKKEVENAYDKQ